MHPSSSSTNPILSQSWCSSTLLVYQGSSSTQPSAPTQLKIFIVVEQFGIGSVLRVRVRVADFYDDTAAFRCSHCPEGIHTPEKWHRPQKRKCGKMTSPNAMDMHVTQRNDVGSVAQSEFIHDGRPKGFRGRFLEPDPVAAVHEGRSGLAD